jgi:hypothetical protein
MLSVLYRIPFTPSVYPFGIFKLFLLWGVNECQVYAESQSSCSTNKQYFGVRWWFVNNYKVIFTDTIYTFSLLLLKHSSLLLCCYSVYPLCRPSHNLIHISPIFYFSPLFFTCWFITILRITYCNGIFIRTFLKELLPFLTCLIFDQNESGDNDVVSSNLDHGEVYNIMW